MNESTRLQMMNPAVVKGGAFAVAGFFVLAAPHPAEFVLRLLVGGTLLVVGASDLWGLRRGRDTAHGPVRAALALVGGIALLVAPGGTIRVVELVVAGYLAGLGLVALHRWYSRDAKTTEVSIDAWKGAVQLAIAVLIVVLPGTLFSLALVSGAVGGVVVGLVMIVWGLQCGPENAEVANRGLAVEIFWSWLCEQDMGRDRRSAIADTLYFEGPDRRAKITSYVSMLLLSVTIASLAVLQDSTAVIIGAMLVAPLMTPIMGCAAALVAGWRDRVLKSFAVVAGSVATLLIMVPLGLTGKGVLQNSDRTRRAQRETITWLGADSTMQLVRVTTRGSDVNVMLTGSGEVPTVAELERALAGSFGTPVKVTVEHFPSVVVTSADQVLPTEQETDRAPGEEGNSPQETVREKP